MSLSTSLANALSGLNAASRAAEVVSSNVSNVMTAGYARRELNLSPQSLGGNGAGVRIDSVTRAINQSVINDRRLADAEAGNTALRSDFLAGIEARIGLPGEPASLGARIDTLEAALIEAASRPDSAARLQGIADAADALADHLGDLDVGLQQSRMDADASIARQVGTLNDRLSQIDRLNAEILTERSSGRDATALMDQRQSLVDRVAEIVPVREVTRQNDQIALFTTGGAILLEGNPAVIGFTPAGVITADMTLASGALSGLTINGQPVASGDGGVLGGGTLGAHFAIRDTLAPGVQEQLDAFARDLIDRFADPALDPTLAPGQPGLFTDAGNAFDPLLEIGLAGHIRINAAVDPAQGGALWRLRDGIGAVAQGDVGNATLIGALTDRMAAARVPASGPFIGAAVSTSGLASDILSQVAVGRQEAEARTSFSTARQEALTQLQLQDGVDTDAEMQNLLMVEQAYSANARVIQTIDDLIQQLIGL